MIAAGMSFFTVTAEKSPILKSLLRTAMSVLKVTIVSETALKKVFIATPIRMTVPLDAPSFFETRLTIITAAKAPTNENRESRHPPKMPKAVHSVTASPAPELTPIILGEARRFARVA